MFGNNIIHLSEVDSTNNFIANLISTQKVAHGTEILADLQTAGRGQRGNNWTNSNQKQFAVSIYVDTAFLSVEHFVFFNFAIAVAVRSAIQDCVKSAVQIKWPNDIFIDRQKIAGILIETNLKNQKIEYAVVGIGINLNPVKGISHATSLVEQGSSILENKQFLFHLNAYLSSCYDLLRKGEFSLIKTAYENNLWMKGVEIPIVNKLTSEVFNGTICEVNNSGNLLVQTTNHIEEFRNQELGFELNYAK